MNNNLIGETFYKKLSHITKYYTKDARSLGGWLTKKCHNLFFKHVFFYIHKQQIQNNNVFT